MFIQKTVRQNIWRWNFCARLCPAGRRQLTRDRTPQTTDLQTQTPSSRATTSNPQRPVPSSPIQSAQQVPGAARTSGPVSNLSLEQAIALAIDNNLATLLAKERENEARGFQK